MNTTRQNANYPNENCKRKATFVVKVDYCQNNSWQGKVTWADENKTKGFRSAMELIKLVEGALKAEELKQLETDRSVS